MSLSEDERQEWTLKRGERTVETNSAAERKCTRFREHGKAVATIIHSDVLSAHVSQTIDDNMRNMKTRDEEEA